MRACCKPQCDELATIVASAKKPTPPGPQPSTPPPPTGLAPVAPLVDRFDRRGIEPLELFRSEFGQNSLRIEEILLEFIPSTPISTR